MEEANGVDKNTGYMYMAFSWDKTKERIGGCSRKLKVINKIDGIKNALSKSE